jgi:hypothetical protein
MANALFVGWSEDQEGFRWSECPSVRIIFELDEIDLGEQQVQMELSSGSFGFQEGTVFVNGTPVGQVTFPGPATPPVTRTITFNGSRLISHSLNEIQIKIPTAGAPAAGDPRTIGLAFSALRIDALR